MYLQECSFFLYILLTSIVYGQTLYQICMDLLPTKSVTKFAKFILESWLTGIVSSDRIDGDDGNNR